MRKPGHGDISQRCRRPHRVLRTLFLRTLLICTLAAIPLFGGQSTQVLSLSGMLRAVADNSKVAVVGNLDIAQAQAAAEELHASYLPTVEFQGGYTVRDNPVVAIFGDSSAPMGLANYSQAQIRAVELLWDRGQRAKALEAGHYAVDAATAGRRAGTIRAQIEGMGSYLQAVLAGERREVVQQRIRSLRAHLEDAENLYKQGMVARNDLLETRVRLRSVKDQLHEVANQLADSRSELNRLMGLDPWTPTATPQSLPVPPPLPSKEQDLSEETTENNSELATLEAQLLRLQAGRDADSLGNAPKLILSAAHSYEQNPYIKYEHANSAMLGVSWKLYDGGALKKRVAADQYRILKIQRSIEETRRKLTTTFDSAFREYEQALRVAGTAQANVEASVENLRIVTDQYRAGLARSSDVLDAETLLSTNRLTLAERRLAAYMQQATVLAVAGRDLPSFYETVGSGPVEDHHE